MLAGLVAGLAGNLGLARLAPGVSWLWWNPAGFALALAVAVAASGGRPAFAWPAWDRRRTAVLLAAFVLMLAVLAVLPRLVAGG